MGIENWMPEKVNSLLSWWRESHGHYLLCQMASLIWFSLPGMILAALILWYVFSLPFAPMAYIAGFALAGSLISALIGGFAAFIAINVFMYLDQDDRADYFALKLQEWVEHSESLRVMTGLLVIVVFALVFFFFLIPG